jgi:hypothetical protein
MMNDQRLSKRELLAQLFARFGMVPVEQNNKAERKIESLRAEKEVMFDEIKRLEAENIELKGKNARLNEKLGEG